MKIETLDSVLTHKTIDVKESKPLNRETFNRVRVFTVLGNTYRIVWWANACSLHTECGVEIPFNHVEASGTWPNRYKTNLQFYREAQSGPCAIIPIESYEAAEDSP